MKTSGMRINRKRGQGYEHRFNEWTCDEKNDVIFSASDCRKSSVADV